MKIVNKKQIPQTNHVIDTIGVGPSIGCMQPLVFFI